jgi:S-adenosylmethionine/arginine decarboxylase-like enzyme
MAKRKKKYYFGAYLMFDLYDCDPSIVGSLKECYSYLDSLSKILGTSKLAPPFIIYTDEKKYPDKAGLSGWVAFFNKKTRTFSGASIHTLTPTNFVSIDIYCGDGRLSVRKVKNFIKKFFKPKRIEEGYVKRGEKYKD